MSNDINPFIIAELNQSNLTPLNSDQNTEEVKKVKRKKSTHKESYSDSTLIKYGKEADDKTTSLANETFDETLEEYIKSEKFKAGLISIKKANHFDEIYALEYPLKPKPFHQDLILQNVVRVKIDYHSKNKLIALTPEELKILNEKMPKDLKREWGERNTLSSASRKLADTVDKLYSEVHPGEVIFGVKRIFDLACSEHSPRAQQPTDDLIQIQYSKQTSKKLDKLAKETLLNMDLKELRNYIKTKDYKSRIIYNSKAERFEKLYRDTNGIHEGVFTDDLKLENVVRVKIDLISRKKLISLSDEELKKINPKIPLALRDEWRQVKTSGLRSISRKLADEVDAAYSKIRPGEVIFGVERIFNLALKNSRYFSQAQSSTPISEERPTTLLTSRKRPATSSENPHKRRRTHDNSGDNPPEVNNNSNNNSHNNRTPSYPNALPAANNTLPYQGNENDLYHYPTYPLHPTLNEQFRVTSNQASLPYDH